MYNTIAIYICNCKNEYSSTGLGKLEHDKTDVRTAQLQTNPPISHRDNGKDYTLDVMRAKNDNS